MLQTLPVLNHSPCRILNDKLQEVVGAIISAGMNVRNLSMASNEIGDAGVGALTRLLDDEPGYRCMLASLDLRGNNIGSEGCKARFFRVHNPTFLSLNVVHSCCWTEKRV